MSKFALARGSLRLSAIGISVATAAATAVGASGQVAAAPANAVPYTVQRVGQSVQINVDRGAVAVEQGILVIRNAVGTPVSKQPLYYFKDSRRFPIAATAAGRTVTLTPVTDVAQSVKLTPAQIAQAHPVRWAIDGPQTQQQRDDEALQKFITTAGAALTISSIIGMVIGGILGGVIGCLIGATAAIVGCFPGIMLGVSLGSIAGVILGGGGGAIAAGVEYINTINSPFKPRFKWVPDKHPPKGR